MPFNLRATVNKWKHPVLFLFVLLLCLHLVSALDLRAHIYTEVYAASFLFLSDPGFGDKLPNLPTSSFQLSPSNFNLSLLTHSFLLAKIKIHLFPREDQRVLKNWSSFLFWIIFISVHEAWKPLVAKILCRDGQERFKSWKEDVQMWELISMSMQGSLQA